jgi:hypothetical protein
MHYLFAVLLLLAACTDLPTASCFQAGVVRAVCNGADACCAAGSHCANADGVAFCEADQ